MTARARQRATRGVVPDLVRDLRKGEHEVQKGQAHQSVGVGTWEQFVLIDVNTSSSIATVVCIALFSAAWHSSSIQEVDAPADGSSQNRANSRASASQNDLSP